MAHDPASVCVRACVSPYMKKDGGQGARLIGARRKESRMDRGRKKTVTFGPVRPRERERKRVHEVAGRGVGKRGEGGQGTGTSPVEANL